MIREGRRGQTEFLSVGVIFSIIIVIAIIGASIYVIVAFMGIGKCADIGLFKDSFQDSVDRAWTSEIVSDVYTGRVPNGIESVCFSSPTATSAEYADEFRELKRYIARGNMLFYPAEEACDQPYVNIEHIDTSSGFVCFQAENGEVRIGLEKNSLDSLVKIKIPSTEARR
ncbi:hypothetical protein CO038_03795 [Candidatus Pacearchaeota archaeon CG_4_9_14_0_2_um_filter_39_13]|nr:hypothetical protein [Candidatus Pacearchaeota archaeon]OIO44116.1 MAG: hypothetical protein AUJ64_00665 [Candidatus Pacearchaeota archaeon CG1_02_39_14]PJC44430.1 MAG: hypothetical protein CO038_03795 [Candidatus Pacearchaeota archaeon CG_4_9_14_0_2_um_filter_39_13]